MLKKLNMRRLFAALMVLFLAMPILVYSGCDCMESSNREKFIIIYEDGTAVLHDNPRRWEGCWGYYDFQLSPEEVAYWQSQGVPVSFWTDQARANWEARGYPDIQEHQRRPPERHGIVELTPLDINPEKLSSDTVELGPSGGGREGGGVRGGGGTK